jgi:hypothetical protein
LIAAADLSSPDVPGWQVVNPDKLTFKPSDPPEVTAEFPKADLYFPILRTFSSFDDFDLECSIRFLEGEYDRLHAGVEFRYGDGGDYVASISPQGTFRVGWHAKSDWGGTLSPWQTHPELKTGWDAVNRLRVLTRGPRIQFYLNGFFAGSIRDTKFHSGLIRIVLAPKVKHSRVAFSDIILRELPNHRRP